MGKGDKKSRRGKIFIGSYGVRRPRKKTAVSENKSADKLKDKGVKDTRPAKIRHEAREAEVKSEVQEALVSPEPKASAEAVKTEDIAGSGPERAAKEKPPVKKKKTADESADLPVEKSPKAKKAVSAGKAADEKKSPKGTKTRKEKKD